MTYTITISADILIKDYIDERYDAIWWILNPSTDFHHWLKEQPWFRDRSKWNWIVEGWSLQGSHFFPKAVNFYFTDLKIATEFKLMWG